MKHPDTATRNGTGSRPATLLTEADAAPASTPTEALPLAEIDVPAGSEGTPAGEAPGTKGMKRSTRRRLVIWALLAVLVALGFGGSYLLYSRNFVSTDNAEVDGDKVDIVAPTTGTLIHWQGQQGAQVTRHQVIGRVEMGFSVARPQMVVRSPGNGTIAVDNVVEGQWITAGAEMATAYDFNKIYVTARVDENDIDGVQLGAPVDISVDAYSGAPITGLVTEIQAGAAGQFSLFPQNNSSGNFQKVTQVIPVRIAFTNTAGKYLVPGMNVTVHIHKQPQH